MKSEKSMVCSLQSNVRRQAGAGFTLLELLVVIAIIGILAVMLIPTVGRVQERGRLVQCASNLKQLHVAAMTYQNVNGGFPASTDHMRYWEGDAAEDGQAHTSGWVASVSDGERDPMGHAWWYDKNDGEGIWSVRNGNLFEFVGESGDASVYVCPTMARYARRNFEDEKRVVTRSYGMNPRLSKTKILGYGGASRTFLFADQGLIDMGGNRNYLSKSDDGPQSGTIPSTGDPYWDVDAWENEKSYDVSYNLGVNGVIDFNRENEKKEWIGAYHGSNAHEQGEEGGVANVVFVDGHVEQVPYAYTDYVGDGDWEDGEPIK